MSKALYAGTFDPITVGHMDIIERARRLFDEVYVVMFDNYRKSSLFTIEERKALIEEAVLNAGLDHVYVDVSDKLAVEYAKDIGADVMVRGLRATQDYHYESMMAYANQYLDENIEMVFLMTRLSHTFVSSSAVKEIASHHHDVSDLVPECVNLALIKKYSRENE